MAARPTKNNTKLKTLQYGDFNNQEIKPTTKKLWAKLLVKKFHA